MEWESVEKVERIMDNHDVVWAWEGNFVEVVKWVRISRDGK
jgi:hypothetical protein